MTQGSFHQDPVASLVLGQANLVSRELGNLETGPVVQLTHFPSPGAGATSGELREDPVLPRAR